MNTQLKLTDSVMINTTPAALWHALTDKEMIKKYFWGTETNTDWKEGSPISFTGNWEGKKYEDKGFILKIEPEKIFKHSYWSSFWGSEFTSEDFSIITYELINHGKQTELSISQEGFKDEQARDHSIANWKGILEKLIKLLENK